MWWNFVARTPQEIADARTDWEDRRRFGDVTGIRGRARCAEPPQVCESEPGQLIIAAAQNSSASPLYRAKADRLRPVGSAPPPLKKANVALGLLARSTRANSRA